MKMFAILTIVALASTTSVALAQAPRGGTTLAGQDNGMKSKHMSSMKHHHMMHKSSTSKMMKSNGGM